MSEVTREHIDYNTGHPIIGEPKSTPPTPAQDGSSNVFVNGKGVIRKGDKFIPHGSPPHTPVCISGSNSVFVNGQNINRKGDPLSCSIEIRDGSPNVFAGD